MIPDIFVTPDFLKCFDVPEFFPAPEFPDYDPTGHAGFLSAPSWQGKPTRVFVYWSLPKNASPTHPVPGVVLVHGGGGTAFPSWCQKWNERGYAAIVMDNCGGVPCWSEAAHCRSEWPRHSHSGPSGWGHINKSELPPQEQWVWHGVAAVTVAHSFLRSLPEVDAEKIGVTGISWGGFLTCLVAGLDKRYKFAIPVYGCGCWENELSGLHFEHNPTPEQKRLWHQLWDPKHYLPEAKIPMLFFSGANDFAFPLSALNASFNLVPNPRKRLSYLPDYSHDHTISWGEETIYDFAAAGLENREEPSVFEVKCERNTLSAMVKTFGREISSRCYVTRATGAWQDRKWQELAATRDGDVISAELIPGTQAAFFVITDDHNCRWCSEVYRNDAN